MNTKEKAVAKINGEMQAEPDNRYLEIIGQYVIDRCTDEATCAQVAAEGKTLQGAMSAVMAKAKKAQRGNVAVLMPGEVFGAVDTYFGMPTDERAQLAAMMGAAPAASVPASRRTVALDFDDFL